MKVETNSYDDITFGIMVFRGYMDICLSYFGITIYSNKKYDEIFGEDI